MAHLLHIAFVARQCGELVTQLLLHAAAFALESLFQLSTLDHLAIDLRCIITGTPLIADHPCQKK
ncbi:hypothetical protein D3C78_1172480 [compost metagenome]